MTVAKARRFSPASPSVCRRPRYARTRWPPSAEGATAEPAHRHWSWAKRMHRAFELDVLACPQCGGRLRLIAIVEDPREIREVLTTLGLSAEAVDRAPPARRSLEANSTAGGCA